MSQCFSVYNYHNMAKEREKKFYVRVGFTMRFLNRL